MCPNNQLTGRWRDTPLAFHKHNLKKVRVLRNGVPVVEYSRNSNTQLYFKTIENLHFDQDGPLIKLENYENHYYLVSTLPPHNSAIKKFTTQKLWEHQYGSSSNFRPTLARLWNCLCWENDLRQLKLIIPERC